MNEQWKPIPGWECYEISNQGNVRSLPNEIVRANGFKQTFKGTILKQSTDPSGYLRICVSSQTRKQILRVHRLVATEFIPNPHGHIHIRHKDDNRLNNHMNNLEWVS